jgi:hypothetical protein
MSRRTDGLSRLVVFLAGLSLLAMTGPAVGQGLSSASELGPAEGYVLSWAEQPADESEKEKAVPSPPSPTDLLEQPKAKAAPPPEDLFERPSMLAARRPIVRLAGMPNMFGDSFDKPGQILGWGDGEGASPMWTPHQYDSRMYYFLADLPPLGGARRVKIGENNKALPMDRVYFAYNYFHNALESIVPPAGPYSVDRYTIGLEKTFHQGLCSAEIRMPFVSRFEYEEPGLRITDGHIGNLGVTLKRLIYATETSAAAVGLSIDTPTGSNLTASTGTIDVTLHNDAVHLLPFIGFLTMPNDVIFYQGFLQLDLATNGNRVDLNDVGVGKYTEQNLLFVDICVGRWLYRDPSAHRFRGLAAVLEYHFATTLQDADVVGTTINENWIELRNIDNRMDISNVTAGVHAVIGRTTVRVGGVFPVADEADRLFDAELQVSVNRYF